MWLSLISLLGQISCALHNIKQRHGTGKCKALIKPKWNETLERVYFSLVRYRLGLYQTIEASDLIVQKALQLVEFATKSDE